VCVCVCVRACAVCIVRASLRAANVDRKCPSNMNPEDVQWKQQGLPDHNARFLPVNHSYARFVHANTCMQPAMHVFVHVYRNSSYYFDSMGSLDQICASASTWPMSTPTHTYILIHKTTNSYTNIQIHTCTCKHTHTHTHTHTHKMDQLPVGVCESLSPCPEDSNSPLFQSSSVLPHHARSWYAQIL